MGDDSWDKDDPEGSIREFFESEGIQDCIKGHRPVSVMVEEMEVMDVFPSGRGLGAVNAVPIYQVRGYIVKDDGSRHEAWYCNGRWFRDGSKSSITGENMTIEQVMAMTTKCRRYEGKKIVERFSPNGIDYCDRLQDVELVQYQPKL